MGSGWENLKIQLALKGLLLELLLPGTRGNPGRQQQGPVPQTPVNLKGISAVQQYQSQIRVFFELNLK